MSLAPPAKTERNAAVVKMYGEGVPVKVIAKRFNIGRHRTSVIIRRELRRKLGVLK